MKYSVKISSKAVKALKKFPKNVQKNLKEAIDSLQEDPRPYGYIKMKGVHRPAIYRVRVGNYRVIVD